MKLSFTFLALLITMCSWAQNLTGTWEGVLVFKSAPLRFLMHLELKQEGKKLTGIFYYASLERREIYTGCEISGQLGRKGTFPFRLISGSRLAYDRYIVLPGLENIRYLKDDTRQVLYGQCGDIEGGFAVKKIDDSHPLIEKYSKNYQ